MKSAYERVDEREGWMTEYNVKHKFSSPWRVREAMQSIGIGDYLMSTLETFQVKHIEKLNKINVSLKRIVILLINSIIQEH